MTVKHLEQLPKAYVAYAKVVKGLILKPAKMQKVLPQAEYVVDNLKIDNKHLEKYNKVTGFKNNGLLPPTYLAVLSQALQMSMMTSEAFPFPIIGLVHIRNSVTMHRQINASETLSLSCKFGILQPHEKGVEFDFITVAKAAGQVVFEGTTTYLIRQKTDATEAKKAPSTPAELPTPDLTTEWSVPENIGRQYGAASGDFNLIHVHAITAKAFGFPKAIAHGMWTKAHSLAELDNAGLLPNAYTADVQFKLPVLLPAKVTFKAYKKLSELDFTLSDSKTGKPHLAGEVKAQ